MARYNAFHTYSWSHAQTLWCHTMCLTITVFLYIVALQFFSGKTIPISKKDKWAPIDFDYTKCRCRSDSDGHSVFEFYEIAQKHTCASYAQHKHICACPKHHNLCISFPNETPKLTVNKYASDPNQNNEMQNMWFLGSGRMCLYRMYRSVLWLGQHETHNTFSQRAL